MITAPIIPQIPESNSIHKNQELFKQLNTLPDAFFENITSLANHICNARVAIIDLTDGDKNAIKSYRGFNFNGLDQELEFVCLWNNNPNQHVLVTSERINTRFEKSALLATYGLKCLTSIPLLDRTGRPLGTLTIGDDQQRLLTQDQEKALTNLSNQIMGMFEERIRNFDLQQKQRTQEKRNSSLEQFAGIVSHDLKTPLGQLTQLIELLENDMDDPKGDRQEYIQHIKSSSSILSKYVDEMLSSYKKDHKKESINVIELIENLQSMFRGNKNITINFRSGSSRIIAHKAALTQILVNLISNGIKHNDKNRPVINITLENNSENYLFRVQDNGPGIPENQVATLRTPLVSRTAENQKLAGKDGIGLLIFKQLVSDLGGVINVVTKSGMGSIVSFTIAK
ncbi:MAG: GAF domain-containing sensor histidine kinase [Flavobacteriaceae bacterium]|nr:GAF domain-containing sensor histidine kinase [Flavobacteriaceae bacterium]